MSRTLCLNLTDRGFRVYQSNRADKPTANEYGVIYTPAYNFKADTLRVTGAQWLMVIE